MIAKAEDEKASAFAISKEDIDSVLQKGSGVADGNTASTANSKRAWTDRKILSSLK